MRNFDEFTITEAVLERVRNAPDPCMRQVNEALVGHRHAFVGVLRDSRILPSLAKSISDGPVL
jgi:hydroxyquinol 1,2-dioxygenase